MKKLLCIILAVLMLVCCLTACAAKDAPAADGGNDAAADAPAADDGGAAAPATKPVDAKGNEIGEIAYVAYITSIPYWTDGLRGLEDAAADLGLSFDRESNFYGPMDTSGTEQATIIEQLVAKGVSGIIVSPADNDSIIGACKAALDAGIPIITVISGIDDTSAYYGELGASNYNVGVTGGTFIAEKLGGKGKVGILTMPGVPVHAQRSAGYVETLSAYPDIELLELVDTGGDPTVGQERAAAMIQANPDLSALIGTDSGGGASAARAVEEAGKVGEIIVVAMDRDEDLLGYIKNGVVTASVASRSYTTKYLAMHYMYWTLTEAIQDVGDGISNLSVGLDPVPTVTDTGNMLITADNVDIFLEALA